MESWRVCRPVPVPVVADFHYFVDEQGSNQIHINKCWIRIRVEVKSCVRIRIQVMWILPLRKTTNKLEHTTVLSISK